MLGSLGSGVKCSGLLWLISPVVDFPRDKMNGWFTSKYHVFEKEYCIIFQTFALLGFKMLIFTGVIEVKFY